MKPLTITMQSNGLVILEGDLTFVTINKKTVCLIDVKKIKHDIIIDFARVNQSDSAGLALLIEWLKRAKIAGKVCRFRHIPLQLLTLAKLSGFDITPYFAGKA